MFNKWFTKFKLLYTIYLSLLFYLLGFLSFDFLNNSKLKSKKLESLDYALSNFISYSLDFEDFILYFIFYDTHKGFYIDVGAHDPIQYSVTKVFYDKGWNGINIEPLPNKYPLFKKIRIRDINLQVGAGEKEGNATLLIKNSGSSIIFNKSNKYKNVINIKIKTLANICRTYIPKKKQIEFCKIDVERFEKFVLLGFDFDNYRPKVFCIESLINKKTHKPEYLEWENILFKNNYDFAYNFRRNRYYFDKRIPELKEKFKSIDFYINKYINKF